VSLSLHLDLVKKLSAIKILILKTMKMIIVCLVRKYEPDAECAAETHSK